MGGAPGAPPPPPLPRPGGGGGPPPAAPLARSTPTRASARDTPRKNYLRPNVI
ncbi:MAG: hypothetical protein RML94_15560 [Bacteroidia bacterium]|nr:hypothetical protein [Bacteroidia bacterium]